VTWGEFLQAIVLLRQHELHVSMNSRLDQLLQSHGKEMKAEGIQEERDRPK
jgi:hypothetical protein